MTTTPLLWKTTSQANQADSQTVSLGFTTITLDEQINTRVIELSDGNYLVAWDSNVAVDSNDPSFDAGSTDSWDIIGRIFDPFGNAVGDEFRLNVARNADNEGDFEIAATSTGFVVVFEDYEDDSASSNYEKTSLIIQSFTNAGVAQDSVEFKAHTGVSGGYYGGGGGIIDWFAGLFGINDDPTPTSIFRNPNVAISGDIAMVTYEKAAGSEDHDVRAKFFDLSNLANLTEIVLASQTIAGNITVNVTEMTLFNGSGVGSGINNHDVATLSNGNFAMAVSDQDAANDDDIIVRIVDTSGAVPALGSQINIATGGTIERDQVQIDALEGGGLVILYRIDGTGGTNSGLRFRIMENDGSARTGEISPHAPLNAGNQDLAAVTALKDGGFVIAWNDDELNDLYLQRFNSTGGYVGSRVQVQDYNSFDIQNISMETLDDGRFVINWTRENGNGDYDSLKRIYDPRDLDTDGVNGKADLVIGTPGNDTALDVDTGITEAHGMGGSDHFIVTRLDGVDLIHGTSGFFDQVTFNGTTGSALNDGFAGSNINLTTGQMTATVNNLLGGTFNVGTTLLDIDFVSGYNFSSAGDYITLNGNHLGADGRAGDDEIVVLDGFANGVSYEGGAGTDRFTISTTANTFGPLTHTLMIDMVNDEIAIVATNGADLGSINGFEEINVFTQLDTDIIGDGNANVIFGSTDSDAIDNIQGGAGADEIFGRGGDDNLYGDAGEDELNGGGGNDFLYGGTENDTLVGGSGDDQLFGEDDDDTLDGGSNNDTLTGNNGRDTLIGGSGDDDLFGNRGNDFFDPGSGQDDLDGGGDFDRVSYATSSAGVTVDLENGVGFGGDAQGDTYIRIERVTGSEFDDDIIGNELGNSLRGRDGIDTIFGGDGRDVINGDDGNDILYGQGQNDNVLGDAGDDTLFGNSGFDKLYGGLDNDTMTGGADADYFVFESNLGAFGQDIIMDFEDGVDKLDVRGVFSIANPANIADDFSDFTVDVSAAYGVRIRFEAGQVIYLDDAATGITVADIDASDFIFA